MPYKPRTPCRFSGCSELTHSRYCEKHQSAVNKHYNKYQRAPETFKRYGTRWRKIRKKYISQNPLCMLCERMGKLMPAEEVHHIKPLSDGGTHSENNLMSLCKSCHSKITATEGRRFG